MIVRTLCILLASLWIAPLFGAQDCTLVLEGKVVDAHDQSALAGATLVVLQTGLAAVADLDGSYRFRGLCPGTYEVEISHPECRTTLYRVSLEADKSLDITLEHHLEELQEVSVFGQTIADKTHSAQEVVLEKGELERFSAATLGDALAELNGVSTLNTGANLAKPVIHGLSGSRVLILNDGVRMQDMEWGDEHAPNVDVNAAGSVTLIKGASALQYGGDALGGVVVLEPDRLPIRDTLFGQTLLSGVTNGRGGTLTSELTRSSASGWFVRVQGSYKMLGDQQAPDYILSNTGIRERAGFLQVGKHLPGWGFDARYSLYDADIAILRASHIGNVDDLIESINQGTPRVILPFTYELNPPRQEVTHHLGKFNFYRRFREGGKWTVQYDFQKNRRYEYDIRVGEDRDKASIDLELTTHTLTTDYKWVTAGALEAHAGLTGRYQDNFANPATGVRRLIPDYEKYDLGAFVLGVWKLNPQWSLDAGARYDFTRMDAQKFYRKSRWEERGYSEDFGSFIVEDLGTQLLTNPVFTYHNASAALGAKYTWGYGRTLRLNYAFAQRPPNPSELFSDGLHHSAARIELGDLRIGSESSHKFSASLERNFQWWGLIAEPFANLINDFILLEPTGVEFTIRGAFPVWEYRQTRAHLLGIDASAYFDWHATLRSEHGFSLVKGKDVSQDVALINIPPASFWNQVSFSKQQWQEFELAIRGDWVLEQNEFPPNITVYSPEQQQEVLLEINTPPPAYFLLGLRTKMAFDTGPRTRLITSLSVTNLLNSSYRDYLNRQRYFADDLGRNITLQLKLTY